MSDALERVARAVAEAAITHPASVMRSQISDHALAQAIDNVAIKFFPEARTAILAHHATIREAIAGQQGEREMLRVLENLEAEL